MVLTSIDAYGKSSFKGIIKLELTNRNNPNLYLSHKGNDDSSYMYFHNPDHFTSAGGMMIAPEAGYNPGDIPAPFVLKQDGFVPSGTYFKVGNVEITTRADCYDLEWDSKTGIVKGRPTGASMNKMVIPADGELCGTIPVNNDVEDFEVTGGASIIRNVEIEIEKDWGTYSESIINEGEATYTKVITTTEELAEICELSPDEVWQ
jgi:hypothetical protein